MMEDAACWINDRGMEFEGNSASYHLDLKLQERILLDARDGGHHLAK